MPYLRHFPSVAEHLEHRSLQSNIFDPPAPPPMPRHSNNTDLANHQATTQHPPLPESSDYASWDTKATILLSQGILITILVAAVLILCGRSHYRRMNLIRELTDRTEAGMAEAPSAENAGAEETVEERTAFRQIRHILGTPLRALDSVVNSWSSAPSTDYEYYRRILERMEAERESRREGAEERTERLMSAFLKGRCVWEIEEEHFINPLEAKKQVETGNFESAGADDGDMDANIEAGLEYQSVVKDTTNEYEMAAGNVDSELQGVDNTAEENDINELTNEAKEQETDPPSELLNSHNTKTSDPENQIPSKADANSDKIEMSGSFGGGMPGYIYLNVSQSNRKRANTLPVAQSTTQQTTSLSESHSAPSLPHSSSDITSNNASTTDQRAIANQCAICLCDYTKGDTIILSSTSCPHAFHQECIVEWLVKMQEGTPCPCCRQTFVELDEAVSESRRTGRRREMSEEELGRLRRHIQLGFQRGRAFDTTVIRL